MRERKKWLIYVSPLMAMNCNNYYFISESGSSSLSINFKERHSVWQCSSFMKSSLILNDSEVKIQRFYLYACVRLKKGRKSNRLRVLPRI